MQIGEEDIEVNQLVDRDVTNCDVTNRDGTTPDKMNLFNRDRKVLFHTSDDEYRVDKTPGIIDERWRIKCNSYPVDNRGFGQHRNVLNQMQSGDTRDQNLIQILHDVINPEENEDDNDVDDYDDDVDDYDDDVDDYDDDDNGEETSDGNGTNGDVKGSSGSSNGCSDTSSYTNTTDKMPKDDTASATSPYDLSLSLSIEDGDKPQEKLNIDNQTTVPDKKECDIKDNDGDGKREVDEPLQKHDVNATVPADQKEHDVTEHEKRGVDEHVQKCDVNATVECDVTENDEPLQKCDINATVPTDQEEHDVTQQPILVTPQPHPTGNEQVIPSDLQLDSIVDLSGQMLIDAQTGQAHNIDDVDISQFIEVYIVNPSVDNPLQEFQTVKIQLIEEMVTIKEEQEKIDQKVVEQIEVNVNTQVGDVQMKDQDGKVNEDTTEQNKTKEIGENSVRKDDNVNPDNSSHDVTGENEDSTNPDDVSPDKKHDVTVT